MNRAFPLNLATRHHARRLTYWNGLLWSIGNGLCSRRSQAVLLDFVRFKRIVTVDFAFLAAPNMLLTAKASLATLVSLWCLHHLMQYIGMIAFLPWLADLVPQRIRGRFFGLRGRWLCAGEAVSAIACGLFAESWQAVHPKSTHWIGYAIPAGLGAIFMLAAIVPIWLMPRVEHNDERQTDHFFWQRLGKPFGDRAFLALLLFGCWFSFSNGLTQTLQFSYPKQVLQIGIFLMLAVQTGMRLGQLGVSPSLGKAADAVGNKPMMLVCLLITAQGPLFYFFATTESWKLFFGVWVAWIAYAGLNIGLPNLMLKIAPRAENADYLAVYYTCTGL